MTESLLILGPLRTNEVVVVEVEVVGVLEVVVDVGLVVAVGAWAVVVVSSAPLLPQAAATRASASPSDVVRLMGREDKSGSPLDDGFRGHTASGAGKPM